MIPGKSIRVTKRWSQGVKKRVSEERDHIGTVRIVGTKLVLRAMADDQPSDVADSIRNWVETEMRDREHSDRDTEIVVIIGMDPFANGG